MQFSMITFVWIALKIILLTEKSYIARISLSLRVHHFLDTPNALRAGESYRML